MDTNLIFFRVTGYLKYLALSKNRRGHGIHSPFVFDFVSRVFRNKKGPAELFLIEKIRNKLKNDHNKIEVKDLGTGFAEGEKIFRRVSDIARLSSVPKKYGILLSNIAREFGSPLIIEFGTAFGFSTMYLASGSAGIRLITIEGSPAVAEIALRNFSEAGLVNITVLSGSFEEKMPEIINKGIKPGLVFIDGNHRKRPLLEYFEKMAEISDPETVVIIDDINYSPEMNEAWSLIKVHEKVSVTIDIFRMGIVFFRKGISRHNYMIRY